MKKIKEMLFVAYGLIVTLLLTPFIATSITWYLFPNIKMTFIQIMWIFFCVWVLVQYIVLTIDKDNNKKN